MMKKHDSNLTNLTIRDLGNTARQKFEAIQGEGLKISKKAVKSVDLYAHKNPWYLVGIFSFVSVMLGFLFGRRTK